MKIIPEEFRPIPQRRRQGWRGTLLFHARSMADLQALTVYRFVKPLLTQMRGRVLDVGCGEMPYRSLLASTVEYTGIDIANASQFDMAQSKDITIFDGINIPFPDSSFDHVVATEVLEHAFDAQRLADEIYRVLRPGGSFVMTIPFSARVHYAPYDYRRLTEYGLYQLVARFTLVSLEARGSDISVIANKLIVICARLLRVNWSLPLRVPALVFFVPLAVLFLIVAHISLVFGWGSSMDPLGYGVAVRK
jgi:SAM-dependent methyltransferase